MVKLVHGYVMLMALVYICMEVIEKKDVNNLDALNAFLSPFSNSSDKLTTQTH